MGSSTEVGSIRQFSREILGCIKFGDNVSFLTRPNSAEGWLKSEGVHLLVFQSHPMKLQIF